MITNVEFEDFIGIFDTDIDPSVFIDYFNYMKSSKLYAHRSESRRNDEVTGHSFFLTLKNHGSVEFADLYNETIGRCLEIYEEQYKHIKQYEDFQQHYINIQRTLPGQGYHSWHCENSGQCNSRRILATMLYLNDDFEGGETEFLYQSRRITPKTGRVVIWPAGWTHVHRGNPPLSGEKFIATSWLENTNV